MKHNLLLITIISLALPCHAQDGIKTTPLKLFGKVDVLGSACAAVGLKLRTGTKVLSSTIEKVALGSPAFYAGVVRDDKILSAKVENDTLKLIIDRNGKSFAVNLDTVPKAGRTGELDKAKDLKGKSDETLLQAIESTTKIPVCVQMGLCGEWDEHGIGRERWQVLQAELPTRTVMGKAWKDWRKKVKQKIESLSAELKPVKGVMSVHLALRPDGKLDDISVYEGPERPYPDPVNSKASEKLIDLIKKLELPAFPLGSQAGEAHVLIYIKRGMPYGLYEDLDYRFQDAGQGIHERMHMR